MDCILSHRLMLFELIIENRFMPPDSNKLEKIHSLYCSYKDSISFILSDANHPP